MRASIAGLIIVALTLGCAADKAQDPFELSGHGSANAGDDDDEGTGEPSGLDEDCREPARDVAAIFATSCVQGGCHDASAVGGLDLSASDWSDQLIGRASTQCEGRIRVVAGDPDASFLHEKVTAQMDCGLPMPMEASLPSSAIDCIATWIAELPATQCETCGGEACVDLSSSADHCGGCGSACPPGVGCIEGACACPSELTACDQACIDTMADPNHCGGCDRACDAGLVCNAGECQDDCGALTECGGGCIDVSSHPLHCGGCDQSCPNGSACSEGTCGCEGDAPSYAADIEPVFVASCTGAGCHGFPQAAAGLDLRAGYGYAAMLGAPSEQCTARSLVAPGDPAGSYLLDKLLGVDLCLGTAMPKGAGEVPFAESDLVAAWICHGAQP
jgi:hypothetical protein